MISFDKVLNTVSRHGYKPLQMLFDYGYRKKDVWRLPFFYVWGRSDDSVSIYGAFIYVENIKVAMNHQDISTRTSGNFIMESILDREKNPLLQIKIELASNTEPNQTIEKKFVEAINNTLEEQNADYKALRAAMPDRVLLRVVLLKYQAPEFTAPGRIKHRYTK